MARDCRLEQGEECDQCGECATTVAVMISYPAKKEVLAHIGLISELATIAQKAVEDSCIDDAINALTFVRKHVGRGVNVLWEFMPKPADRPWDLAPVSLDSE